MNNHHPAYTRLAIMIEMAANGASDGKIAEALNTERGHVARARYVLDIENGAMRRNREIRQGIKRGFSPEYLAERHGVGLHWVREVARDIAKRSEVA